MALSLTTTLIVSLSETLYHVVKHTRKVKFWLCVELWLSVKAELGLSSTRLVHKESTYGRSCNHEGSKLHF